MSMEQAILELAAAFRENTAALQASTSASNEATKSYADVMAGYGAAVEAYKASDKGGSDAEMEEAVTKVEKAAKSEKKGIEAVKEKLDERLADTIDQASLIGADDKVLDYKADVVPALLALQKKTGGLKDLLTKFGVTKGDQLKAEQYADIVAQANQLAA